MHTAILYPRRSPGARAAPRAAPHALDLHGRLQVCLYAHADRHGGGERCAGAAVLRQVAVLAVGGHAGTCCGCVLARQPAHARSRSGLAPPRRAPNAPNATVLHHMGVCQRQRVDLVRGVPHAWCVIFSASFFVPCSPLPLLGCPVVPSAPHLPPRPFLPAPYERSLFFSISPSDSSETCFI